MWYHFIGFSSSNPLSGPSIGKLASQQSVVVVVVEGVGVGMGVGMRIDGRCAGRGCAACVVVFFDGSNAEMGMA
jgi:hypothetical protein